MQFSTLTLNTYLALLQYTKGKQDIFVPWDLVQSAIEKKGYSKRLSYSELDRFCYGFECIDKFSKNTHEIALTKTGISFLENLLNEAPFQSCKLAILIRNSKRKNFLNATIQETTFFNKSIYELISRYKFRNGGARDFIKSIDRESFMQFLHESLGHLSVIQKNVDGYSVEDCIEQVKKNGKYWASVGGKYSWYVYPQKFELDFDDEDWQCYDNVVESLIRPTEWGGGKDVPYIDFLKLVKTEKRFIKFRKSGIVRPIWKTANVFESTIRITSPGYLMWERKKKGYLSEFVIQRESKDKYALCLCDASDFPDPVKKIFDFEASSKLPKYKIIGDVDFILGVISKLIHL